MEYCLGMEFVYLTNNTWIRSLCGITVESPVTARALPDGGSLVTASTDITIAHSPNQDSAIRSVRLRLLPGDRAVACQLAGTEDTCHFVWNHFLTRKRHAYQRWREYSIGPKLSLTFFSMGKEFMTLRRDPRHAWVRDCSFAELLYPPNHLADAYKAFFKAKAACTAVF